MNMSLIIVDNVDMIQYMLAWTYIIDTIILGTILIRFLKVFTSLSFRNNRDRTI